MGTSITIIAFGTRGDTQPFVQVAKELAARGHSVRVACNKVYESLAREAGVESFALDVDPTAALQTPEGQQAVAAGRNIKAITEAIHTLVAPNAAKAFSQMADACEGADAIISSPPGFVGYSVAEKLQVPFMIGRVDTGSPTRAFPHWSVPRSRGPLLNRLSYVVSERILWHGLRITVNEWRQQRLGLAPLTVSPYRKQRREGMHTLHGISPTLVPPPRDWKDTIHVTGYWFPDAPESWQPPADLAAFLDAGTAPVYVGFGNYLGKENKDYYEMTRTAIRRVGVRCVYTGNPDELPHDDDIFVAGDVPFEGLFPRLAGAVHHGSAGTVGMAVRAGIPAMACPFFADQPFWGDRVHALGLGPRPVPLKDLDVDNLTESLEQLTTDDQARRLVGEYGARLRAENGRRTAADVIERVLRTNPRPPAAVSKA